MQIKARNHQIMCIFSTPAKCLIKFTWVPIEPVDPTIEIGLGPFQFLVPGSTRAVPGHAGGGEGCAEHRTPFPITTLTSFLLNENPPKMNPNSQINNKESNLHQFDILLAWIIKSWNEIIIELVEHIPWSLRRWVWDMEVSEKAITLDCNGDRKFKDIFVWILSNSVDYELNKSLIHKKFGLESERLS